MEFTGLISLSYPDPVRQDKKIIRVYYQVGQQIRESCFDAGNGWYVRPADDVVTNNAKQRSPIAATTMNDGRKTSIFYLDSSNKLRRRVRITNQAGEAGPWEDRPISAPYDIATTSKLSAVRTDEDNQNLRVYYQSTDNVIRGIVSYGDNGNWEETDCQISGMLPGTSICALSGNLETRMFLQDKTNNIKEYYSDSEVEWRANRIKNYQADPNAPITAVAWNYGTKDFQMRVFTLQAKSLTELVYDKPKGGWQQQTVTTGQMTIQSQNPTATSAVTSTANDQRGEFAVFYQPANNVIAQFNSTWQLEQLGIPTARA